VNTTASEKLTLAEQWQIQRRVVWALILRETVTRFGREGLGILWIIAEPALFVVGVMLLWSIFDKGYTNGISAAEFLAVSYPTLLFWRNGTGRVVKGIEVNRSLLHHRPVRPLDIIYARIILEFTSSAAVFFFLLPIFIFIGVCHWPADLFVMAVGYLMVIWFSFAFVMIMAALAELSETVERISHIILYFMLPISGAFIPTYVLPEPYRDDLLYFPLVDCVEIFRHGYFGSRMLTYYHVGYTVFTLLAATLFAYCLTLVSISKLRSR
jgi:capsular polysaccharide transport system permease protein